VSAVPTALLVHAEKGLPADQVGWAKRSLLQIWAFLSQISDLHFNVRYFHALRKRRSEFAISLQPTCDTAHQYNFPATFPDEDSRQSEIYN